jgi:hypothetical protein
MRRHSWLLLAFLFVFTTPTFGASDLMKALDTNNDGTVDLDEASAAARRVSDRLSVNRPSVTQITQDRFKRRLLELVIVLFKAADVDGDEKLDEGELRSAPGRNLEKLLMQ